MKKIVLLTLIPCLWTSAFGQSGVMIDTNNVKAFIPSSPLLFYDGTSTSTFRVPKSGIASPLFTSTPWISGKVGTTQYVAAEVYRQNGADFQSGPVSTTYNNPSQWAVLKLSKALIETYKNTPAMWTNPPIAIQNWPAHGDTSNGQADMLAPFVNVGGDPNLYEPQSGDYPLIEGDLCTYYIFNDDRTHGETGGQKMGVEIHRMAYQYSDTSSFLDNAVFVDYTVINRSSNNYTSTVFSIFSDYDLGDYSDDRIGTDSVRNMVYVYNGGTTDAAYGSNPPAEGMMLLNKNLSSSMYYSNDTTLQGNPVTPAQYANYMNTRWKDNSHLTYGGTGFHGAASAQFAFSGDACSTSGWTESGASITPGDRRILANVNIPSFSAGSSFNVRFAYLYARGTNGPNSSVCALQSEATRLKTWYDAQSTGLNGVNKNTLDNFNVFPNPNNGTFTVALNEKALLIEVLDLQGKVVQRITDPQHTIQFAGIAPGLYFVKVEGATGTGVRKVVINP